MSTLNHCAPIVVATRRSAPERWLLAGWAYLLEARRGWERRAALRAEWKVIADLSDETRRDLGLAERGPGGRTLGRLDHERGRWQ